MFFLGPSEGAEQKLNASGRVSPDKDSPWMLADAFDGLIRQLER